MRIYWTQRRRICLFSFLLFASSTIAQTKRLHPDIQNIGRRDLTPKGLFPAELERESALGAEFAKQFAATVTILDDNEISDYVSRLGSSLVQHSDAKSPFDFKIVDSEVPDVTALPGGRVFVNTGLIVAAWNEAELAAVMSYAIAHVAAHHGLQALIKAQALQIRAIPALAIAFRWSEKQPQAAFELGGILSEYENEADQLAIQYLWNAGYDPAAYLTELEMLPKIQSNVKERLQSAILEQHSLPYKGPYIVNSFRFEAVKSRLLNRR